MNLNNTTEILVLNINLNNKLKLLIKYLIDLL